MRPPHIPPGLVPIVVLDMWEHSLCVDYVSVARSQTSGLIVPAL